MTPPVLATRDTVAIIGGGVFGLATALELAHRGATVVVFDPGPIPHPLAESTDVSKVVRLDYGADEDYVVLGEQALAGWRRWNTESREPLFHETGVTFLSRAPLAPGGFEHDSYELLRRRGHALERLDAAAIVRRFPAYHPGAYVDGYWNPVGGWAAASPTIRFLAGRARAMGVEIREVAVERIVDDGLVLADATHVGADLVIACAGAWVPRLVPELAGSLHAIGQPVFHLRPADPAPFAAARFPVFGADISQTGYYGFPVTTDGIVKIANHGTGVPIAYDYERVVRPDQQAALRAFLTGTFPALADAPIVHTRLCVYGDTLDGQFWIARHPARPNLVVASGGSGHAFKFGPALGAVVADLALGVPHPLTTKFRWRPELAHRQRGDAARSGEAYFAAPPTAEPPTVRSAARSSSLNRSIAPKK